MNKPSTLKDLLIGQHIGLNEVKAIARTMFDGKTTAAGPDGYIITACAYDDLPEHVQGFINKAILAFPVTNVLDAAEDDDAYSETDLNRGDDEYDVTKDPDFS